MTAIEFYNQVKKGMLSPEFRQAIKQPDFPFKDFNKFLQELKAMCALEVLLAQRDQFFRNLEKNLQETKIDQLIKRLILDITKNKMNGPDFKVPGSSRPFKKT